MTRPRVLAATKFYMLILSASLVAMPAAAVEIFKWTDDDGVIHFSDEQPAAATSKVTRFVITPSNPLGYDPAEDEYSIQNQAARTNEHYQKIEERRDERAKKRAEAAEKAAQAPQQFVRYYDEPVRSYFRPWYPPITPYRKHHGNNHYFAKPVPFRPSPRYRPTHPSVPPGRHARPVGPPQHTPPQTPMATGRQPVRWAPSQHPR